MKKNQPSPFPYFFIKELRQIYGQLIIGASTSKAFHVTPDSQEKTPAFSELTLAGKVWHDKLVVAHTKSIMYWSSVVYGTKNALQKEIRDIIQNPALGNEVAWKIAVDPQSIHKFAGINACGLKNKTRKNAETSLSHMLDSVNSFANAAEQAKQNILQKHQAQQRYRVLSIESAKGLHRQQDLSKGSECLSAAMHREVPETSRRTHERTQSSRKKALAFAS
ncbi:BID domain-containing T4SS effector [Bartonella sp. B39]